MGYKTCIPVCGYDIDASQKSHSHPLTGNIELILTVNSPKQTIHHDNNSSIKDIHIDSSVR
jgi:hypothetical protein